MSQRILVGHVLDRLAELPERAVHCCVTSPPYWGLRAYGTEPQVWTNEPDCDHVWSTRRYYREGGGNQQSAEAFHAPGAMNAARLKSTRWKQDDTCAKCGAWRGELGQEPLPDCLAWARGESPCPACFVCHLRTIFAAVWRVLRDDGTCWVNLGDSYASGTSGSRDPNRWPKQHRNADGFRGKKPPVSALGSIKHKDMILAPARMALALQADGWHVRSKITWAKQAPMPESCNDRPTSATEDIYLLTKRPRYFYDQQAVREPMVETSLKRLSQPNVLNQNGGPKDPGTGNRSHRKAVRNQADRLIKHEKWRDRFEGYDEYDKALGRNQRNFWLLGPEPYPDAHFAVFVSEIPRRCILAGTSERGVCGACGSPWRRIVDRFRTLDGERRDDLPPLRASDKSKTKEATGIGNWRYGSETVENGWAPTCGCEGPDGAPRDPVPATVLDPFAGAGTTLLVADQLGRYGIGVELNPTYAELARKRIADDAPMFADVEVEQAFPLFSAAGLELP